MRMNFLPFDWNDWKIPSFQMNVKERIFHSFILRPMLNTWGEAEMKWNEMKWSEMKLSEMKWVWKKPIWKSCLRNRNEWLLNFWTGTNYPGSNYPQPSPCTNSPCGKNALCSYRNETVGCKCPPHLSGFGSDPYLECYPRSNPCEMCGPHSQCVVDERGGSPTICTCLEGKVGSPPNCRDGFCQKNRECGDNQHCFGGRCDDPCKRANCGRSAVCRSMRHLAVCACRNAPDRDPLTGCPPKVRDYYDDGDNSREYYVYRGT